MKLQIDDADGQLGTVLITTSIDNTTFTCEMKPVRHFEEKESQEIFSGK